ncbi:MAG: glycosyltransferase [Roseburia sp.]|nr:glycosyltransferase [Roseburia sp.]MCM1278087.1 glycosyltransferase [Robinsoniella sp.]
MLEEMVSVIVPVYRVERYIARCIESILSQSYKNMEVILVDDGSDDESGNICDRYAKEDSRIVVIHQENQGVSSARNAGLDVAKGKYIQFVDADDMLMEGAIEVLVKAMTEVDLVLCGHIVARCDTPTQEDEKLLMKPALDPGVALQSRFSKRIRHSEYGIITGWEYPFDKLFKKSIIDEHHLRFTYGLCHGEDSEFVLAYVRHISKYNVVSQCLYKYYINNFSAGTVSSATRFRENMYELTKATFEKVKAFMEEQEMFYGDMREGFEHSYINEIVKLVYRYFREDCPMSEQEKKEKLSNILNDEMCKQGLLSFKVKNSSEDGNMSGLLKEGNYGKIKEYAMKKVRMIYGERAADKILLSIVIPVYNRPLKLQTCIESIGKLEIDDVEIIIVDDHSTDETKEVCYNLERGCKQIKVINNSENMSPGACKMRGLSNADGKYVVFLDSDDQLLNEFIEIYKYIQSAEQACDCYLFSYMENREDGTCICRKLFSETMEFSGIEFLEEVFPYMDMQSMWQFVYKKEFLLRFHVACPADMRVNEDYIFNMQVYSYARQICCLPYIGYSYNYNNDSLTHDAGLKIQYDGAVLCIRNYCNMINSNPAIEGRRKELLWESVRLMVYSIYSNDISEQHDDACREVIEGHIWNNLQQITENFQRELWIYPASGFGKGALKNILQFADKKGVDLKVGGFIDRNKKSIISRKLLSEGMKVMDLEELSAEKVGIGVYYVKKSVLQEIKERLSKTTFLWKEMADIDIEVIRKEWG